eukprot:TRINITY_DN108099_c0_g1_i1.p2 TRINITY_DN108099_c0_g1~~TRINITY_DN108099_c0_g1_i1.p2  ORF type:complete len:104 (+),score=21.94 TRINITY_DN108099_c0_g1_i1:126-437(+)
MARLCALFLLLAAHYSCSFVNAAQASSGLWWHSKAAVPATTHDQQALRGQAVKQFDAEDAPSTIAVTNEAPDSEDSAAEALAHRLGDSSDNDDYMGAFPRIQQ